VCERERQRDTERGSEDVKELGALKCVKKNQPMFQKTVYKTFEQRIFFISRHANRFLFEIE